MTLHNVRMDWSNVVVVDDPVLDNGVPSPRDTALAVEWARQRRDQKASE